tara:strand:- start:931 stop:2010 length:1080 start_codon:yes stop_codon:yes gene_type:complete
MPSPNKIILAAAGSGKTASIVDEAFQHEGGRVALVTYTINGTDEFSRKAYERHGAIACHATLITWYTFLLRNFVRPYQNHIYEPRITEINFTRGQATRGIRKTDVARYYLSAPHRIRLGRVSEFACSVIDATNGLPLKRFETIFDKLYIDEAQDLSGYDLTLIEHLMRTNTDIALVGDHRQATFSTHDSAKGKKYKRMGIIDKFQEWEKAELTSIEYQSYSHRCIQDICDFADRFFPEFPKTESHNEDETGHDGVFLLEEKYVAAYVDRFDPQPLRYNRTRNVAFGHPINFGAAKGLTFPRTIVFPHGPLSKYLKTGKLEDAGKTLSLIYVAITRARQSVAFVVPDGFKSDVLPFYAPD